MPEKGAMREEIHCKEHFVSHLFLVSKKGGGQREGFEHIHTLQKFQDGRASSIIRNFGARWLSMQFWPQRRLFLCSIEQIVKEICTFWMGGFSVVSSASLYPLQVVYKNSSIPRRFSNTRQNFGWNNLKQGYCDLPVIESRIFINLKKSVFHPTKTI